MRAKTIILPAFAAVGAIALMGASQPGVFTIGEHQSEAQDAYAHMANADMSVEEQIATEKRADELAANLGGQWLELEPAPLEEPADAPTAF